MSEQKLREFGARAEELVTLPDFADLDRRGGALQRRRIVAVSALAACVLTVIGIVVAQYDPPKATEPIGPPDEAPAEARPYPGSAMETLERGTYELRPSFDSLSVRARITLPDGWNAWEGPNRFNGHAPRRSNEEALAHATWYAGVLVLDVSAVASRPCQDPTTGDEVRRDSPDALVAAITRIPGHRVTLNEEESPDKFGYPATHLRLRETPAIEECRRVDFNVFRTANGLVGGGEEDMWVVDVDGQTILVAAGADAKAPPAVHRELEAMVDSIEFYFPEPPDGG